MTLDIWQKRQAALIDYFASRQYLLGLKHRLDALIGDTDALLDTSQQQGRDALLTSDRWGVRDTSANWATYGFPALLDYRESVLNDLALRDSEIYGRTDSAQCWGMLRDRSRGWMTVDEEEEFERRLNELHSYASEIDDTLNHPQNSVSDFHRKLDWFKYAEIFPRLPRFVVRTDIEAVTGERPPRTGIYVAQDDPYAALQFGWTGGKHGALSKARTFSPIGLEALKAIGRDALWVDDAQMSRFVAAALQRNALPNIGPNDPADVYEPGSASSMLAFSAFEYRPCRWYFVEKIAGEYDDEPGAEQPTDRLRIEGGQTCPREGWWLTPARANSRRYFKAGELLPDYGASTEYGHTIWQWAADQASPSL